MIKHEYPVHKCTYMNIGATRNVDTGQSHNMIYTRDRQNVSTEAVVPYTYTFNHSSPQAPICAVCPAHSSDGRWCCRWSQSRRWRWSHQTCPYRSSPFLGFPWLFESTSPPVGNNQGYASAWLQIGNEQTCQKNTEQDTDEQSERHFAWQSKSQKYNPKKKKKPKKT